MQTTPISDSGQPASTGDFSLTTSPAFISLFNVTATAVCLTAFSDGRLIEVNEHSVHLWGFSREELLGRTTTELNLWLTPEDRLKFIDALTTCSVYGQEFSLRRKSGEVSTMLLSSEVLLIDGQKYILTFAQDISERKALESVVRRALFIQEGLAALSHALLAPDNTMDDMCQLMLHHAMRVTGSQDGHVDSIDPATGSLICQGDYRLQPCGSLLFNTENEFFVNKPSTHPYLANRGTGIPVRNILSLPVCIHEQLLGQITLANTAGDYTAEDVQAVRALAEPYSLALLNRRREHALQESESRWRFLIENASDAVFLFELFPDNTSGSFVEVNDAACQTLGYNKEELQKLSCRDLQIHGGFTRERLATIRIHSHSAFETTHRAKNGLFIPVEISARCLTLKNRTYVLAIARNLTERKQAVENLRRHNNYLQLLQSVSARLLSQLDPAKVLQLILDNAPTVFDVPCAAIGLLSTDENWVHLQLVRSQGVSPFFLDLSAQDDLVAEVLRSRRTVVQEDCREGPFSWEDPAFEQITAVAITPVVDEDKIVGIIGLLWTTAPRTIDANLISVLEQLSALTSVALRNANLHSQSQREIAERQIIEDALCQFGEKLALSEARYRGMFNHLQHAFSYYRIIFDENQQPIDAEITDVNRAFEDFFQGKVTDWRDRRAALALDDLAGDMLPQILRAVSCAEPRCWEQYSSRRHRWVRHLAYSPEQRFVAVISEDITEDKLAEAAIRESESRYRAIMEQSTDGIALVDVETRRFLEVNRQWSRLTGYDSEEIRQLTLFEFLDEPAAAVETLLDLLMMKGELPPTLRRYRGKNERLLEVEQAASLIDFSGKQVYLFTAHDISEERKLQQQINQDLCWAREVQLSLVPQPIADEHIRVETIYQPAHAVSGDFFDYAWNREHTRLTGFLLDVAGHGIASSLQTLAVSVLYRQAADSGMSTSEKLHWVNSHMLRYFPEDTYAAAILFEFDLEHKTLTYATAGIYYFLAASASLPKVNNEPGSYMGIDLDPEYNQKTIPLQNGDAFYLMSDGIYDQLTEADNIDVTDFDGTVAYLRRIATGGGRDDCSAICIQLTGIPSFPQYFSYTCPRDRRQLRTQLMTLLRSLAGPVERQLSVVLEEAINNAVQHSPSIHIKINRIGQRLVIRVEDGGAGFEGNRLIREYTATGIPSVCEPRMYDECGRGLPIMLAWMDRVIFNHQGNEVMLVKTIKNQ